MSSTKRKNNTGTTTNKPKKTRKVEVIAKAPPTTKKDSNKKPATKKKAATKRKRATKKKAHVSRYHQYKDFLIANNYSLRDIKEFELTLACSILQRRNMELQIKLNQDADAELIIID